MEILNPGNILPAYANINSQMQYRCGCETFEWAIPFDAPPSFQVPVPAGTQGQWDFYIHNGVDTGTPPISLLKYSETLDGSKAWIQYNGDGNVTNYVRVPSNCTYWFRIKNRVTEQEIFFERWRHVNLGDTRKVYKLMFYNDVDIDGILYQANYSQTVLLLYGVFDTPDILENAEEETDGNTVERLVFQSVQRREVLRFPYFPDFWQGVFKRLAVHSYVSITKMGTGEVLEISGKEIGFESEAQDICFSKGALSWLASNQVGNFCETNNTMSILADEFVS